jgi:WD40 repeat protein
VSSPAKRLPPHEAVSTPHWGNPAAVRFSRSGARFGAVGEGGLVGLWRQDFISAVDGMGHAEWVGHCLSRSGTSIAFLGDTGSQVRGAGGWGRCSQGWDCEEGARVSDGGRQGSLYVCTRGLWMCSCAVGKGGRHDQAFSDTRAVSMCLRLLQVFVSGVGERGGAVVLVDTLAPPNAATAASLLSARGAVPTTLCLVPTSSSGGSGGAGAVLVVGDDTGEVRGYDVRVLDASRPLWSSRQQQQQSAAAGGSNGVTSLSCWDAAWMGGSSVVSAFGSSSGSSGVGAGDLVACGSRDGSIRLLNAQTGAVVQQLSSAHYTERKGLLERVGLGGGSGRAGSGGLDDGSGSVVLRPRPAGAVPAAVSGLQACAEGLVSVGWDGVVRFAPFTQLLDEWSARAGDA